MHAQLIDNDRDLRLKCYYKLLWLSLYDGDKKLDFKPYKKIYNTSFKATFLYSIFSELDREKAIKIYKKYS